ncbi:MAG: protein kinase [Gemmataceae bacterium]
MTNPDDLTPLQWQTLLRKLEAIDQGLCQEGNPEGVEEPPPGLEEGKAGIAILGRLFRSAGESDSQPTDHLKAAEPLQDDQSSSLNLVFERYHLHRVLGRGGHGIVYLAEDPRLKRLVALKIPRLEVLFHPDLRRRFLAEAQTASRLEHPHLVSVYEASEIGSVCYVATAYCPGPTLAEWLRKHPDPIPCRVVAELIVILADAVAYMHSRGVLHRDLKPGNVILQGANLVVSQSLTLADLGTPRICDFGLAKNLNDSLGDTGSFAIIGTPAYMAPEQAEGRTADISVATDIWALGVILYEVLTGQVPFGKGAPSEVLRRIHQADPDPISRRCQGVSPDLETICRKCLQKDPKERYATAAELANDLRNWLEGKPVLARRHSVLERLLLWRKREPGLAAAFAIALVSLMTVLVAGAWFLVRMEEVRIRAEQETERREEAEKLAGVRLFYSGLVTMNGREARRPPGWTWDNLREVAALAPLASTPEEQAQLRSEAVAALASPDLRLVRKVAPGFHAYHAAYHPNGRWLALVQGVPSENENSPMKVLLVDANEGAILRTLSFPSSERFRKLTGRSESTRSLAISPDGQFLVVGTRHGQLHLWNLAHASDQALSWEGCQLNGNINRVAFSPDGQVIFSLSEKGGLKRWAIHQPVRRSTVQEPNHVTDLAACSPPGTLYCQAEGRLLRLEKETWIPVACWWDYPTMQRLAIFPGEQHGVFRGLDELLHIHDFLKGERIATLLGSDDTLHMNGIAISPDGRLVARMSADPGQLHLWEAGSARLVARIPIPRGGRAVAFHPNGHQLVVSAGDGALIFELPTNEDYAVTAILAGSIHATRFAEDGNSLMALLLPGVGNEEMKYAVCTSIDPDIRTPQVNNRRELFYLNKGGGRSFGVLSIRQSGILAMVESELHVWSSDHLNKPVLNPVLDRIPMEGLASGPDGRVWLATSYDLQVQKGPGQPSFTPFWASSDRDRKFGQHLQCLAAGRSWMVAGRRDGACMVIDANTMQVYTHWSPCDSRILCLSMSSDESQCLVGTERGKVLLVSMPDGRLIQELPSHADQVKGVAFLDDNTVISAGLDGELKISSNNGSLLVRWRAPGPIQALSLSNDKTRLALTTQHERVVRFWRLDRLAHRMADLGLPFTRTAESLRPLRSDAVALERPVLQAQSPTKVNGLKVEWFQGLWYGTKLRETYLPLLDDSWYLGYGTMRFYNPYSIRYSGWLEAPKPGRYQFRVDTPDNYQFWLNGNLVHERGWTHHARTPKDAIFDFTGPPIPIQVYLSGYSAQGYCRLLWQAVGVDTSPVVVPESALYHDFRNTRWHREGKNR